MSVKWQALLQLVVNNFSRTQQSQFAVFDFFVMKVRLKNRSAKRLGNCIRYTCLCLSKNVAENTVTLSSNDDLFTDTIYGKEVKLGVDFVIHKGTWLGRIKSCRGVGASLSPPKKYRHLKTNTKIFLQNMMSL